MLKQVRTALKGVVAWFVIILLVLAFALFGVPEVRNFTQRSPLRVGDVGFSQQTIVSEFNRQVDARRRDTGDYTREQAIAEGVPDAVVSTLATRSVIEQEAAKMGLAMPRPVIRRYLSEDERFQSQVTGEFDQFTLERILQQNGMTVRQFEAVVKQDLLRAQIIDSIAAGVAPPKAFAEPMLLRRLERRRVAYLSVTEDIAGPAAEPTPEAVRAYYDANPQAFTAPEYRTFTLVEVREAEFREGLAAPEEELRKLYDLNKARLYDLPERRTIYQVTYDSEAEAQAAAAALRDGKPFEAIATEKGLTLAAATFTEILRSDLLDPAVGDAAFAEGLAVGDVAGPVQTLFGWTVVQLAGVKPAETRSFEDVREELEGQYLENDTRRRVLEALDAIEEERDSGATLSVAAERAGFSYRRVGPVDSFSFEPGGAILDDVPGQALAEAFRLDEGEEAEAVEYTSEDGYFFVQVEEITPPAQKEFELVADDAERAWRAEERRGRISAAVARLKDEIAGGKSFDEAALALNRTPLSETLERNARSEIFSPALVDAVFNAAPNAVLSGPAGFGEAEILVEVREIGYARNRIGPGEEIGFAQFLGFQMNQELLEAYIAELRDEYGVRADSNAIAQLFSDQQ